MLDAIGERQHHRQDKEAQHEQAQADHHPKCPEHDPDFGNGIERGLLDLGVADAGEVAFGGVALDQKGITHIGLVRLEGCQRLGVVLVAAETLERQHGGDTVADARLGFFFEDVGGGQGAIERVGDENGQHGGHLDSPQVSLFALRGDGDGIEGHWGFFGFPKGFHGYQLGGLGVGAHVAQGVAQRQDAAGAQDAKQRGDAERARGDVEMALAQHIVGADATDEDGGGDVAREHGMDELGLGVGVEEQREEAIELHPHGHRIEHRAVWVLHETVGHQDPERGEVAAQRNQIRDRQMLDFAQAVPPKYHQSDEGGFHEERHQAFDGQGGAEGIAHEAGIEGPIHAELELHGEAGGDAEREVDEQQLGPELGHAPVDFAAAADVDRFHDGDQEGEAQRKRHEKEMVESRCRELYAGEVHHQIIYHVSLL